mgnify:CR=1 FL=1
MEIALQMGTFIRVGYSFDDCLKIASDLGIRFMELWVDEDHFWPAKTSREELSEALLKADSHGVKIVSLCPIPFKAERWEEFTFEFDLAAQDEVERSKAVEWYKSIIEMAAFLDAKTVIVLPGKVENPDFMKSKRSYRQHWEQAIKSLKELARCAENFDVFLGVENAVVCNYINLPGEMRLLLEEVGSSHVKAYLDVANANVFLPPEVYIRELRGMLCETIHATDNDGSYPYHLPIGMGTINYEKVIDVLRETGWDGYLIPEIFYDEDPVGGLERSKEALEKIIRK